MYKRELVGIFPYLIQDGDEFDILGPDLCIGYYTEHSASKPITSTYKNIIKMVEENPTIDKTAEQIMGEMIRAKFIDKWTRIYNALITATYNPLQEYDYNETKTGTNTNTTTYDTSLESNGKAGTKETTTTTRTNSNDVYGFNSQNPVGNNVDTENNTETLVGNADENTSYNKQDKSGTDTRDYNINESITKNGRDRNSAYLLDKELSFRDKYVFADIIYKDIDSILCLNIY